MASPIPNPSLVDRLVPVSRAKLAGNRFVGAPSRNIGLDAVRAIAITLVVFSHVVPFYKGLLLALNINPGVWENILGYGGVELFFALSGFLIGGILLGIEARGISWEAVRIFFMRRWLRTLPLYYLILGGLLFWHRLDPGPRDHVWLFTTLTQNLFWVMPRGNWYGVSWSLTIEEWSYLLLPVLAFGLFGRTRRPLLYGITLLSLLAFVLRLSRLDVHGPWALTVRSIVIGRLDAICYGAYIAVIYRRHCAAMVKWSRRLIPLVIASVIIHGWLCCNTAMLDGFYSRVFALAVLSLSISLLLPLVAEIHTRETIATRFIRYWAKISYATYLVHIPVYFLTASFLGEFRWLQLPVFLVGTTASASLISYCFEQPIMRMRPRQI
jgi:peptidoglycan/LPS O-acetylase OafA/YrhL